MYVEQPLRLAPAVQPLGLVLPSGLIIALYDLM